MKKGSRRGRTRGGGGRGKEEDTVAVAGEPRLKLPEADRIPTERADRSGRRTRM
jgi:hypothetical protein